MMKTKETLWGFISIVILSVFLIPVISGCSMNFALTVQQLNESGFELITDGSRHKTGEIDCSSAIKNGNLNFSISGFGDSNMKIHLEFDSNVLLVNNFSSETARVFKVLSSPFELEKNYYIDSISEYANDNNGQSLLISMFTRDKQSYYCVYYADKDNEEFDIFNSNQLWETITVSAPLYFKLIDKTYSELKIDGDDNGKTYKPSDNGKYKAIQNAYTNAGYIVNPSSIRSDLAALCSGMKDMYSLLGYDVSIIGKNLETSNQNFELYMLLGLPDSSVAAEIESGLSYAGKSNGKYLIMYFTNPLVSANFTPFDSVF